MNYLFLLSVLLIALAILWLPALSVCLLLRGMGVPRPNDGLYLVWTAQLLVALLGIAAIVRAGWPQPAALGLALLLVCSVLGALRLWSRRPR